MKRIFLMIFLQLLIIDIFFPLELYKKNEIQLISSEKIEQNINYNVEPYFYKKNYLMPNGKYSDEKSIGYKENIIPENIINISNKYSRDSGDLLARWILLSNWGLYSNGNNPFAISYSQSKKILPSIPSSSTLMASFYQYSFQDSNFKLTFVKLASFSNIEESFQVYSSLLKQNQINDNFLFLRAKDSLKILINNLKHYKSDIDSNSLLFNGKDTITRNDSNLIISYRQENEYEKVILPNYLLYTLLVFSFCYIYFKTKNGKSI